MSLTINRLLNMTCLLPLENGSAGTFFLPSTSIHRSTSTNPPVTQQSFYSFYHGFRVVLACWEHRIFHTLPVLNPSSPAERSCKVPCSLSAQTVLIWQLSPCTSPLFPKMPMRALICQLDRSSLPLRCYLGSFPAFNLFSITKHDLSLASVMQSESGRLESNIAVVFCLRLIS